MDEVNVQMGKKLVLLFLTMIALIGLSGWYIAGGIQAYSRDQQSNLAIQEHCGGQSPVHICVQAPSVILSAYYPFYVASHSNLFMIQYSSGSPLTLEMSISITGFSQMETHTVNAIATVQSISFIPSVISQSLRLLTADESASLHVSVLDTAGHKYYINDIQLMLRSRWLMQWTAANRLKIAAWVTPNDPAVIDLVRKSAAHLPLEPTATPTAMIGYNNNRADPRAVRDQVDAIFDAMRLDYRIKYSQAPVPYAGPGENSVGLQYIKLPSEVMQQRSGMCIELTALLASAVEHIGLNAEIVIIPGHAFLGVAVTQNDSKFEYWDAVQVNSNIAGDSANLWADSEYYNAKQVVDKILISDARNQGVDPML
jgi:hypothetical protein